MQVTPLTPVIGAEVTGLDLTRLEEDQFEALRAAFTAHSVLFFRDQPRLAPEDQVAFCRRFGELHTHPAAPTLEGHPEVFVIHAHKDSKVANGNGWHTWLAEYVKHPSAGGQASESSTGTGPSPAEATGDHVAAAHVATDRWRHPFYIDLCSIRNAVA